MTWFTKLCRNLGLMVHNIRHPDDEQKTPAHKKTLRKTTEQEQRGKLTLRRTTIEEIEYRPDDDSERSDDHDRGQPGA